MEEVKNPVGRPSKYDDKMQALAEYYYNNFEECGDKVPTVVGLAIVLDVATNTVYNWANENNPEFLRIFTRVEQMQHKKLVNGGLDGSFNPAITKMMLTKHGYSDKQEVDHTTNGKDMAPTFASMYGGKKAEDGES